MKLKQTLFPIFGSAMLGLALSTSAGAAVVSGTAEGYGVATDLNAFGGALSITVLPVPGGVSVTAPAPDNASDTVLSVDVSNSLDVGTLLKTTYGLGLTTGVISATADSNVDGGAGSRQSNATASVDGLDFGVGTLNILDLLSVTTVGLTADTISSSASVTGDVGGFSATGSTTLENANLSIAGLSLLGIGLDGSGDLVSAPAPNLTILDALGVTVVLNRQLVNGAVDGVCAVEACSISVDAIAIEFSDFVFGGNLLNGGLTIGHSEASLAGVSPVPVPAAVWLFGSGLVGIIGIARRRRTEAC